MGRARGLKKAVVKLRKDKLIHYDGHTFPDELAVEIYKVLEDFRLRHNYFRHHSAEDERLHNENVSAYVSDWEWKIVDDVSEIAEIR